MKRKNELKSIAKCHDVDMRQIILRVTIKVECYCLESRAHRHDLEN